MGGIRTIGVGMCVLALLFGACNCEGDGNNGQDGGQNNGAEDTGGGGDDTGGGGDDTGPADTGVPDSGGADTGVDAAPDTAQDVAQPDMGTAGELVGPSKGGSIAVNDALDTLAVANKATNDVTFFSLPDLTERGRVAVDAEPVSVTWAPDNATVYVVCRADQTVVEVTAADTATPMVGDRFTTGSEPGMAAMSPSGASLYVSATADGLLHEFDTATGARQDITLGGAPYAVCVTNDRDGVDGDEFAFVTDFWSRPSAAGPEATDRGRAARVFRVAVGTGAIQTTPLLAMDVTGVEAAIDAENTAAFPNQLYSCAINANTVYVTAVGASPESFNGGTDFRQNVHGLVYALDVTSGAVIPAKSVNLSTLVSALTAPKRFVAVPVDIGFVANSDFGYIASMTSNAVLRVDFGASPPVAGAPSGTTFLAAASQPTGIAINGADAYVYNEVSRAVSHLDLAQQTTVTAEIASAPQPAAATDQAALRGQRFFNTGLGRWSANGWVACAACHPFGTTDNVTWSFPAGPRQTVDTAATFDAGGTVQRVLNWTAIFDEIHDFELNTRGVANGTGAIVSDTAVNADGTPNTAVRIDFVGPGGVPNPTNGFNVGSAAAVAESGAVPEDWNDIEAYIATIRSPRGRTTTVGDPVAGRAVFETGNCQNCHGGALWTLSELYYTPLLDGDLRTLTLADANVASVGSVRADQVRTTDTSAMSVLENDANGAPQRHSCVVRKVGTFDVRGPANRGAAEVRQNAVAAQGVDGFNVPSLLGVNLGGPYLHHGGAETLEDLLDPNGDFTDHLQAGNQVFAPTATDIDNLIAFVQTIDDTTPTIPTPAGFTFCPVGVVPP